MRQAIEAGNMFDVQLCSDRNHTRCCPAAETVQEALDCAQAKGTLWESTIFVDGVEVAVFRYLPQSQIGCAVLESVGLYIL